MEVRPPGLHVRAWLSPCQRARVAGWSAGRNASNAVSVSACRPGRGSIAQGSPRGILRRRDRQAEHGRYESAQRYPPHGCERSGLRTIPLKRAGGVYFKQFLHDEMRACALTMEHFLAIAWIPRAAEDSEDPRLVAAMSSTCGDSTASLPTTCREIASGRRSSSGRPVIRRTSPSASSIPTRVASARVPRPDLSFAASIAADRRTLDWTNQPHPFKRYEDPLPVVSLSATYERSLLPAMAALTCEAASPGRLLGREFIGRLCYFATGVTRVLRGMPFRAAACTGALYHLELYAICGELPDLAAGVYQYSAREHALRQLRAGDLRGVVRWATGDEPSVTTAPVLFAWTSTFWRNAWKYEARSYRHAFWDMGTVLANLLAVARANDVPARVLLSFADQAVNDLLDVDPTVEAALSVVTIGAGAAAPRAEPPPPRLHLRTIPASRAPRAFPAIGAVHDATTLPTPAAAQAWRAAALDTAGSLPSARSSDAHGAASAESSARGAPSVDQAADESIEAVILRRGSARGFGSGGISFAQLEALLDVIHAPPPLDVVVTPTPYLIVNAVDGLAAGAYTWPADAASPRRIALGDFRRTAAFLDLGQSLAGEAALNVYWLTSLSAVHSHLGERGYRAAQLAAGLAGGRLYLAAYALGLAATGLTFFDAEVSRFFAAADQEVLFLMAVGHPASRPRR